MTAYLLPTPPRARGTLSSRGAMYATLNLFNSGATLAQIEDLAVAFIEGVAGDGSESSQAGDGRSTSAGLEAPKATPRMILDGTQADLRRADTTRLLTPPMPSASYQPRLPIGRWVNRLVLGGQHHQANDQYMRDLGVDLDRHTSNLHRLRSEWPAGWTLLRRAQLGKLITLSAKTQHEVLVAAVAFDHAMILAALHARMLAEYLRRLATEPMGPRLSEDEPLWPMRGRLLHDRLVEPAKSVDRLMRFPLRGNTNFRTALDQALASGHLAHDPRLLGITRRVHQRSAHLWTGDVGSALPARLAQATTDRLVPLRNIRHAEVRDQGVGRESFAEARLGLSVPQAVTVLATNLVAFPIRLELALATLRHGDPCPSFDAVPLLLPKSGGRVRRIATTLKAISGCDRYVGDASAEPDNKAGRKLLRQTRALLESAEPPHGLNQLHISPGAWLR